MKLADQLNAISKETNNIANRLKVIIQEKLTDQAQLGAKSTTFTFRPGTSAAVRRIVIQWFQREGLAISFCNPDEIAISWGGESSLQERADNLLLQLDTGRDHVVLRATFYPEDEVKEVLVNLQLRGYQVTYDDLGREMSIRKGVAK